MDHAGSPQPHAPARRSLGVGGSLPGGPAAGAAGGAKPKGSTAAAIERIQREREERRRSAEFMRRERDAEIAKIEAAGIQVADADFQRMISAFRAEHGAAARPHAGAADGNICVIVRKRPISRREVAARDWDSVTCLNPRIVVHAPKLRVDGITKYLENTTFEFDQVSKRRANRAAGAAAALLV